MCLDLGPISKSEKNTKFKNISGSKQLRKTMANLQNRSIFLLRKNMHKKTGNKYSKMVKQK